MAEQLVIGTGLILLTVLASAVIWAGLAFLLARLHNWLALPPHGVKIVFVLCLTLISTVGMMTISVWIWALAFLATGVFDALEPAVYFSLVAFTTLGFGDILLPPEWRLLGGLAAANGLLIFGLLTAALVESLRETRLRQRGRQS